MLLIDRYIFSRFITNFVILFALLFTFAVAIDLIFNLSKFIDSAQDVVGENAAFSVYVSEFFRLIVNFQGPRLFQFYAYLHGMVAIGAMGFTLSQMHRHRELVAVMASGASLRRVAMPFIIAVFGLSLVQLLNQELLLPKVAPLLLRKYSDIGQQGVDDFKVLFTPDGRGNLLQSPSFDPQTQTIQWPTILERDDRGRTVRRITATSAKWSSREKQWKLVEGKAIRAQPTDESSNNAVLLAENIDSYTTDLTPEVLMVRRYNQFAAMLSLSQIQQMLNAPHMAEHDTSRRDTLLRYGYSRLSSVLVNLLVLGLALPCFLLREPAPLMRQSVLCAALTLPASVGSAIGMMVELPGIPPAAGVFLPVIVLIFLAMFPWTFFKT